MQERIVRSSCAGALAGLLALCPVAFAGDVGVAVNVSVPGIYGQLSIGELPPPELLLPRPIIAVPVPVVVAAPAVEPLYLHVPPGHEKHWARHCREYDACDRPVYFVSQRWYEKVYVPRREWRRDERAYEHEHEMERAEEHDRGHREQLAHERGHGHEHEGDGESRHGHDHERD